MILENKKPSKKINKPQPLFDNKYARIIPFLITGLLIILLIIYLYYSNYYSNFNYLKQDSSRYLVYTRYTKENSSNTTTVIPFVNIKGEIGDLINNDIKKVTISFLKNNKNTISYTDEVNGDILSIVLKFVDNSDDYIKKIGFRSYNINLKTQQILSDDDMLKIYNTSIDDVERKIKNQFIKFYNDEVEKGIIPNKECNFDCYLEWRNVKKYTANLNYYINDGKLIVYKAFDVYSIYEEETYFNEKSFVFSITE